MKEKLSRVGDQMSCLITFCTFLPQARLVYVNYAMIEDFKKLRDMNIIVSGHIVIAKYGKIYRGDKVS